MTDVDRNPQLLTEETRRKILEIAAKYDDSRSAVMPALGHRWGESVSDNPARRMDTSNNVDGPKQR